MASSNKETLRKVQEAWNQKRFDDLDQYFAPDFKANGNDPSGPLTLAAAKASNGMMNQIFSERRVEILDLLEHGEELGVASAEMHELVVRPTLDDTPIVEHVDAVRRPDAREAVRDEEHRPAAEEVAHAREEVVLRARVERRGRLVQDDERRVPKERARERDALPLTDRNVLSAHEIRPEDRVVAIRPGIHERIGAGAFRRPDDRIEILEPLHAPEADVLAHGEHEAREVLKEHGDALVDPALVVRGDVSAVPQHPARVRPIETGEHFGERGLARSVLADQRDDLARADLEGDIVQREA